jgi:hypothetical protein
MFSFKVPVIFVGFLIKLEPSQQSFGGGGGGRTKKEKKRPNIKFRQNPSSGSRVLPCGQTDMTKLIVAFRNFVNAAKKSGKMLKN